MRRLLFILPFVVPGAAFAQSQAANPVAPFSEGQRVGTSSNPLFAALSSVVPSAAASSGQAAAPVELYSYGRRVGTQGNPIYINLGNALTPYLTQSQAASTYLPLTGGTVQSLAASVTFSPPSYTYSSLPSPCIEGTVAYSPNGYKFWSSITPSTSGGGTQVYQGTEGATGSGSLQLCTHNSKGALVWLPILMNTSGAGW
ncbi:hypothetical protein HW537_10995 [Asaia siamensis]